MFNLFKKRKKATDKEEEFRSNVFKQYGDRCQRTARICGKKAKDIAPRHMNLDIKERQDYRYYFPVCNECKTVIEHELSE